MSVTDLAHALMFLKASIIPQSTYNQHGSFMLPAGYFNGPLTSIRDTNAWSSFRNYHDYQLHSNASLSDPQQLKIGTEKVVTGISVQLINIMRSYVHPLNDTPPYNSSQRYVHTMDSNLRAFVQLNRYGIPP